jgi:hypothetical protein
MASGAVVQFAVLSVILAVLMCLFIVFERRKTRRAPSAQIAQVDQTEHAPIVSEKPQINEPEPSQTIPSQKASELEQPEPEPQTIPIHAANAVETAGINEAVNNAMNALSSPANPQSPVVIDTRALTTAEDRNERILAGISANIQKSLQMRPVPQHSPIPYSELTPRSTEYVRVKKEIITPHGQIRFSILKDAISTNMLALLRRASLGWKTPDDLIAFVPSYLRAEAEILNDEVLLIGTTGHNEKLAVPIRKIHPESSFRDCFDFVTDDRTATSTPAVLLPADAEFQVVSKGVIVQPTTDVKLVVDPSADALQKSYTAALGRS